jgi:hypothetical protein
MTAIGYILAIEVIVKASWSLFQHDGAAAFKLSARCPLPPHWSTKVLPGGRTQILNVCRIQRINHHLIKSTKDCAPESISDTEDLVTWNGDLDNPNDSNDDCEADIESDMEQDTSIEDSQWPKQQDMSTVPIVPGSIWPTRKSRRHAEKAFVTVNAIERGRNKGILIQ